MFEGTFKICRVLSRKAGEMNPRAFPRFFINVGVQAEKSKKKEPSTFFYYFQEKLKWNHLASFVLQV
jgi:hypothetical protein